MPDKVPMKNTVHPGRIVLNEKAAISPDMAIRLEKAFGGSAKTWLQVQLNYDYARADPLRPRSRVSG